MMEIDKPDAALIPALTSALRKSPAPWHEV